MTSDFTPGTAAPDAAVQRKYAEERAKRLRGDGNAQFIDVKQSQVNQLAEDPWADHSSLNATAPVLRNGDSVPFLIVGTGLFGLQVGVRLVQAGIPSSDIRFVDDASSFGGTWYWNRYPGLMCDAESYIYLPLLEETGYMPKHKYSYGAEIREQTERVAKHFGLDGNAQWRTRVQSVTWNENMRNWSVSMVEYRGPEEQERNLNIHANFVVLAGGGLSTPKLPKMPGLNRFKGEMFHTSRWNYNATGGSQIDPSLTLLKDKVVGIIGTGATSVQVIPELAKWAKHLYVFQRTPVGVDVRGQRETDPKEWENNIAVGAGWQHARQENFVKFMSGSQAPEDIDLVKDGWTKMRTGMTIFGGRGPYGNILSPDQIPAHVAALNEADFERTEQVRARVDSEVKDPQTAGKLKAWYPTWCKRPTFHDDYLAAFNRPNVTLVDTDGKGCAGLTEQGVLDANTGVEYPVDILVFGTGYRPPFGASPAHSVGAVVRGCGGLDMDDAWRTRGPHALHGIATPDFPNMFFMGTGQGTFAVTFTYVASLMATHIAHIASNASRGAVGIPVRVEVTREGAEAWTGLVAARAAFFAFAAGCTPSFFNNEGERDKISSAHELEQAAGGATWSEGAVSYGKVLADWRDDGSLNGYAM